MRFQAANVPPLGVLGPHESGHLDDPSGSEKPRLRQSGAEGDGKPLATLLEHESAVTRVMFSHEGATIASKGADGTVRLWFSTDTPERREYRHRVWREQQAQTAESSGEWFAAAFHLSAMLNQEPGNKTLEARWEKAIAELAKVDEELAERATAKSKKGPTTTSPAEKAKSVMPN